MQPRRDFWPLRGETVFQVTKRGYESEGEMLEPEDREVRLEGVEAWVEGDVKLDEEEFEVGVSLFRRREMAGARDVLEFGSSSTYVVPSSSSLPDCSVQSCSIWDRDRGFRLSKLATSDSKQ
jgi:hypothetical protein